MSNNEYLINFLRNIISKLEQGDLSDQEKRIIFEFMCKTMFSEDISKHKSNDLIKYLSLGYFIYNNMNSENNL
jgi:hypothetical protein